MPSDFEKSLVEAARAGDPRALAAVLNRLERVFRSFFLSRIGLRDEVDDLVQNALLRVHTGIADLQDPSRLKAFAMKAAFFELQDLYRGRYRGREALYDPLLAPDAAEDGDVADRLDLERAMAQLSPHARRIIELREYGFRYEEIAAVLGTTEAAIKMQVKRAFEKLREILASIMWISLIRV